MKLVKSKELKVSSPDDRKLRELILYIAAHCEADEKYSAVKLNKILFYSDFVSYAERGKAITDQEYQALPNGPCPRRIMPILSELQRSGAIEIQPRKYHGREQKRAVALCKADTSLFTPDELELVDRLIQELWGKNASEVSLASHDFIGWQLAEKGETIPYQVALIGNRPPTENERKRGLELQSMAREYLEAYKVTPL